MLEDALGTLLAMRAWVRVLVGVAHVLGIVQKEVDVLSNAPRLAIAGFEVVVGATAANLRS